MSLSCGEVRRILWPPARPRGLTDDLVGAHEHLATCEACRSFLEDMESLGRQVRQAAPDVSAPIDVRNRLYAAIARARTATPLPRSRRSLWPIAAAVAALVAVGSWVVLGGRIGDGDPFADLAHEHSLALGGGIASANPDSVADWLSSRVPFAARVPSFDNATLEGAHLCLSQCRQGVVMEYQVGDGMVSYYVMPADVAEGDITPLDELDTASRSGYRIASWREPGLLHVMVGNVPEAVITNLAVSCRRQFQTDRPDGVATVEL